MWLLNPYWYTSQYSAPVSNYLDQVIAADVAAGNLLGLEDGTKTAYATFIDNLIVDGYLGVTGGTISQASSVIKASPIMAGARTLNGALVPLVGTAPTNFNFVSGDYNRKTGLAGNGSTKYLNSNRNNNADPQNNQHLSCYATAIGLSVAITTLTNNSVSGVSHIGFFNVRSRNAMALGLGMATGFNGISRSTSDSFVQRVGGASITITQASETPVNDSIAIFRSGAVYGTHRLAFYSIGEALDLDLALIDARVTTLINAFAAAIP